MPVRSFDVVLGGISKTPEMNVFSELIPLSENVFCYDQTPQMASLTVCHVTRMEAFQVSMALFFALFPLFGFSLLLVPLQIIDFFYLYSCQSNLGILMDLWVAHMHPSLVVSPFLCLSDLSKMKRGSFFFFCSLFKNNTRYRKTSCIFSFYSMVMPIKLRPCSFHFLLFNQAHNVVPHT